MKQNKLFKLWLLALILLAGSGVTWGQTTFTWNFGTSSGVAAPSSGSLANLTVGNVSIGNTNGTVTMLSTTSTSSTYTGASGSYNAGNAARIGDLSTGTNGSAYFEFTLTPASGYSISLSSISFGSRGTTTAPVSYTLRSSVDSYASDITSGTLSANSTWALKSNTGLTFSGSSGTAITFRLYGYGGAGTPGANTINWRIDDLSIVVSLAGGTPTVATPTFTPAAGSYYTPQNVTLSSTTDGAAIYYTTDGTDPNNAGNGTLYSTPISVSATTTIKAKAYASSYDPSSIASATYTFPTINEVANIAALRAITLPSTEVYKLTGEALLSFKTSSRNAKYIQDASGGILIDDNTGKITTTYNVGDGITGITGKLAVFNGMLQFTPVTDPGAATSTGNTITPVVTTLTNLGNYPGQLVKVTGLTISGTGNFVTLTSYTLSDGTNSGVLRTQYSDLPYIGSAIPTGSQDITGVVLMYNSTAQLIPRTSSDFTPTVSTTPTITVTETTVPAMTAVVGETPDTEIINVGGTNLTGNITVTIDGTNAAMFSVVTNPSPLTSVGGTATITYTPTAAGTHTATLHLNSTGATEVTRTLSGTATIPVVIPDIMINEVDADTPGTDVAEFIELYDGGVGNTSLNGFVVVLFNGSDDKSYAAYNLDGYSTDANGYFVIGSDGMGTDIELTTGWLQNGADAVALFYDNVTSFPNGTSVTTTNLVDALVYDTNDADDSGLLVLLNASQSQIDEAGRSSSDNHSMQRLPNGTGGARNTSTYDLTYPTPGAANVFREVTWTGATDTNWATTTNWTPNLVPDRGVNATIANVTNGVVLGAIGSVNNLTIAPNAKLTINSTLSVAGNLTIVSDATNGTGTLVDNGTLTVNGTTTVNQAITNLPRTYYAGIPVAVTSTSGIDKVATFTESTDLWSALSTNTAGTMTTAGQGYLIQVPTESNISFNGSLNTGDKTVGLTIGNKTYNFLGNPYPSYLDGQKVVDATASVEKSIWYRTKTGASTYGFVTYNVPTGVSIPATAANNGFIPPMQGFWLKATAAGNYTFTNTMRTHNTTGTAIPLKAPQAAVNQILRLQVSNGTALDETVLLFNENAITGYDSYDASKMMNTGTGALNIYTVLGTENLALNSQPEITYGVEIPVGMNLAAGTYTISANEFSNFAEGTKAQLLDKATGTLTDLTTASYNFTLTEALNSNTRFALVFPQNAPTGVDNAGAGDVTVFTRSNRIVVTAGEAAQGSMIYVFNGVGQRLAAQAVNGTVTEIGRTFPAGVYVVKVNNMTAKVVVK